MLAGDEGRGLVEVLQELADDLARQEAVLRERRERLAVLLAEAPAGHLPADGPVSPEFAALLAGLGELPASPWPRRTGRSSPCSTPSYRRRTGRA